MSSLDLTRDWLVTVLRPYSSRDRILPEILNVLQTRRTLAVKTDAYTFDSGQTALLLHLHGTLPITFRGATYQIPLAVWVPHEYPRAPPLAYVVPTKEMGVRKSREVEPSGRVRDEVVAEWWRTWPTKDVQTLLAHLTDIFSAAPPVYAKPPEPTASSSRLSVVSPPAHAQSPQPLAQAQQQPPQPPPPPARPFANGHPEQLPQYRAAPTPPPTFPPQSPARPAYAQSPPPQSPRSPPVPSRPTMHQPHPSQLPQLAGPHPVPTSPQPNSPTTYPPVPQRPYQPRPAVSTAPSAVSSFPPTQSPLQYQQMGQWAPADPHTAGPSASYGPLTAAQVRAVSAPAPAVVPSPAPRQPVPDLLSSPNQTSSDLPPVPPAALPPKPPPPSLLHLHSILLPHLTASLPPLLQSLHAEKAHLLERREDLRSGEPAVRDEMARLEAVRKVCESTGRKVEDVVRRGSERVAELEARGEVSVDEIVCGISIVHNQLIDLVAEDNAIEDTIYHLARALDAERIDLDRFLKATRTLAREQYMKRALIERILQGMGQTAW
ncbi:Suppressor protein stp22 of temperature-sensitive alpha-factor receptor and arginine permease [Cryptotrichosporon argae]